MRATPTRRRQLIDAGGGIESDELASWVGAISMPRQRASGAPTGPVDACQYCCPVRRSSAKTRPSGREVAA